VWCGERENGERVPAVGVHRERVRVLDVAARLLGVDHARLSGLALAGAAGALLCALADGLDALRGQEVPVRRVLLIGGGAQSPAVREIAPAVLGLDVAVPPPGE